MIEVGGTVLILDSHFHVLFQVHLWHSIWAWTQITIWLFLHVVQSIK